MSKAEQKSGKKKGLGSFWRAARFVFPYRRLMVFSIISALFVGGTTTVGLTLLMPIMRLLFNGDTLPAYVDRSIAEHRLGVRLDEKDVVTRVEPKGPALSAGVEDGDRVADVSAVAEGASQGHVGDKVVAASPTPFYAGIARRAAALLPQDPIATLACLLGGLLGLTVFSNFFRFFQEHYSDMVAIRAVNDVRRKTYDHLLHVPLGYFGQRGTSDATSRLVADAASLQEGFKLLLGQSIQAPIMVACAFGYAVYLDWRVTAFIVLFAPINMAIIRKFGKKIRRATRTALEKNSKMLGQIEASLSGIQVVKASMSERFERRRYARIMSEVVEQQRRMSRYEAMTTPTMETLTMGVVMLIILFAAYLILKKRSLEIETFFSIMVCLGMMGESLRKMSKLNNLLQKANAASGRIFEILDLPVERRRVMTTASTAEQPKVKLPVVQDAVTFEDACFKYPGSDVLALDHVSLAVPKGRVVAVVGRNGSGKTTLLRLLPRLYAPSSGRVLIDGVDIANATLPSLRSQISLVTQESVIFPGTIAENIAYGLPLATRAEVEAAAQKAFAHDFIIAKPQGYDTTMEGTGGQLSGGQRQRLCIARAILRHAPILILDEATSQVDAQSEHLIQQAIDTLLHETASTGQKTTTFVIAHRFSTILGADEIVVMDAGRIVGQGKHRELLETCPTYKQLYERQVMNPGE